VRVPYRVGDARGVRYGAVPPEIESAIPRWLATRAVEGGVTIKATRVYRLGSWLVKFTGASRALKDVVRKSSAIRIADLHAKLAPIRTPAPLLALEVRKGPFLERSLLVTEWIEGRSLAQVWDADERATAAFPKFLAELHRRNVFHGDLHPENLIWNGSEWVLIDLGALRHPLRTLAKKRLILEQWAQLDLRLAPSERVRRAFEEYLRESESDLDSESSWGLVLELAAELLARRGP
jgi:tRNA A-37 threonylcarbamoyl transferase component Bud32